MSETPHNEHLENENHSFDPAIVDQAVGNFVAGRPTFRYSSEGDDIDRCMHGRERSLLTNIVLMQGEIATLQQMKESADRVAQLTEDLALSRQILHGLLTDDKPTAPEPLPPRVSNPDKIWAVTKRILEQHSGTSTENQSPVFSLSPVEASEIYATALLDESERLRAAEEAGEHVEEDKRVQVVSELQRVNDLLATLRQPGQNVWMFDLSELQEALADGPKNEGYRPVLHQMVVLMRQIGLFPEDAALQANYAKLKVLVEMKCREDFQDHPEMRKLLGTTDTEQPE